jgi:hypothetical protein
VEAFMCAEKITPEHPSGDECAHVHRGTG